MRLVAIFAAFALGLLAMFFGPLPVIPVFAAAAVFALWAHNIPAFGAF